MVAPSSGTRRRTAPSFRSPAAPRRGSRARRRGVACRPSRHRRWRSSGRRARTRATPPAPRGGARQRSAWKIGPSSQSSSSQRSASRICSTFSGVERSRSVSSMRSTSVPVRAAREQPVEQGGARPADVQGARGRWSETQTHRVRASWQSPRLFPGRVRAPGTVLGGADRSPRLTGRRPAQGDRAR